MANLVTIGEVKTFIGIDANCDTPNLNKLIGYVSAAVETYLGRTIALTEYREWYDGSGIRYQRLSQWPITRLYQVSDWQQTLGRLTYSGAANEAFASSDGVTLTLVDSSATDITLADSATGADLVTAVALVTGWTLNLLTSDMATQDTRKLRPFNVDANDGNTIDLEVPEDSIESRVSDNSEWLIEGGFAGGSSNIFVWYKAGYSSTPEDLKWAVLQIMRDAYYSSKAGRDITKDGQKLGDYSYKNAAGTGGSDGGGLNLQNIIGSYSQQLSPYKRVEWA